MLIPPFAIATVSTTQGAQPGAKVDEAYYSRESPVLDRQLALAGFAPGANAECHAGGRIGPVGRG